MRKESSRESSVANDRRAAMAASRPTRSSRIRGRVAIDAKGNFYISDFNNNCVWRVNSQGIITTLAGTRVPGFSGDGGPAAAAQLSGPHGITADAAGNVYIADSKNNRVRRVGVDGIIVTIAGNGQSGASGDGGPATAAAVGLRRPWRSMPQAISTSRNRARMSFGACHRTESSPRSQGLAPRDTRAMVVRRRKRRCAARSGSRRIP